MKKYAILAGIETALLLAALPALAQQSSVPTPPPGTGYIWNEATLGRFDRLDIQDPEALVTYSFPDYPAGWEPLIGPYARKANRRKIGTGEMTADYGVDWSNVGYQAHMVNGVNTPSYVHGWAASRVLEARRVTGLPWELDGAFRAMTWVYSGAGQPIGTDVGGYDPSIISEADPPGTNSDIQIVTNVLPVTTESVWNSSPSAEDWKGALAQFKGGMSSTVVASYDQQEGSPSHWVIGRMKNHYNIRWHLPYEDPVNISAASPLLSSQSSWNFYTVNGTTTTNSGPGPYPPENPPPGVGAGDDFNFEVASVTADAWLDYINTKAFISIANKAVTWLAGDGVAGKIISFAAAIALSPPDPSNAPAPVTKTGQNSYDLWRVSVTAAKAKALGDNAYAQAPNFISFGPEGQESDDTVDDIQIDTSVGHTLDQHWINCRLLQVCGLFTLTDTGIWTKKYGSDGYQGPAIFKVPKLSGSPTEWPDKDSHAGDADLWYGIYSTDYNKP